ncbi:hypothetical protein MKW94_001639 [Papaver nudicaule]|uniref:PPM-type phosphatase domain-containing protein n=1 Tax=Papaver nudicaule TaxID=74823 RepID=A0AA41VX85_PAPNU|nr:hypothetical protein [Papaver nudicaule]
MGNGLNKLTICISGDIHHNHRRKDLYVSNEEPLDEGLGHSFCYVRPEPTRIGSTVINPATTAAAAATAKIHSTEETNTNTTTTTFRSISGASVSANTSTPLTTAFDLYSYTSIDRASAFESSTSFASFPLQPVERGSFMSGPLERGGFMSGPIERGFMSGPLDRGLMFSGPLLDDSKNNKPEFQRSFSHGFLKKKPKGSLIRFLKRVISRTWPGPAPARCTPLKDSDWGGFGLDKSHTDPNLTVSSANLSSEMSLGGCDGDDDSSGCSQNLQWAQGKAGEDRVHVVISEEHGWVFVGIYDGFNGPDAPDYLLTHLYPNVHKEMKGLLWDDAEKCETNSSPGRCTSSDETMPIESEIPVEIGVPSSSDRSCVQCVEEPECYPLQTSDDCHSKSKKRRGGKTSKNRFKGAAKKWEENQRRWKGEWDRERLELDQKLKERTNLGTSSVNQSDVLKALAEALKKTEESYLEVADKMVMENPELALMGSCVLVMLMKGEDVYVMNVGDSRAVLAQKAEPDLWLGKAHEDLERIKEETSYDLEKFNGDRSERLPDLNALQLTLDHSTSVEEEVQRIKSEHPDDALAVSNDRVKGSLKVTRAFGAGFLKQPKWNNALLEMFRIDYVGTSPYITCFPFLHHHRLGPKDKFLILSSDGLYQYFTNEEAVSEVELFIATSPEGDPAQHLIEEVLFRAAKKAGLDFHELLEIPQGDRRRYHDDVSIIVISLEGRIWRSCM